MKTLEPVRLEGDEVVLEPMERRHVEPLAAIGLDPELWRLTTIEVLSRDAMEEYVASALCSRDAGIALPFVIFDRGTGEMIGSTRLHSWDATHRRIEIGFSWLARPWQRSGANTEAKYLLLRHAFEDLDCVRVQFRADSANLPSRRALERIGVKFEGLLRSFVISPTKGPRDLAMYSIVREEWPAVRSRLESMLKQPR